jgi:tripartite-type tricarboxylate transporter receptor subunit TctC
MTTFLTVPGFRWTSVARAIPLALSLLALASPANSQNWPSRPVTVIVPYSPGGFTDTLARIAGQYLSEKLGQSFVIENRPGAGGGIGTTYLTKANPDGYTLMFGSASQTGIAPLTQKITYDPNDLMPVSIFGRIPFLLAVNTNFPANDLAGFVAHAKSRQKSLNNAITGAGTTSHLLSANFAVRAGIELVDVPYKGSAPGAAAVMQGDIDMTWAGVSDVLPLVSDGKLKALAISSPKRLATLPNIASVSETYPGFSLATWNGFYAPRGTPKEVIEKVSRLMREAAAAPEVVKRLQDMGIEPSATTPEEMAEVIRSDKEFYVVAVKAAGIKPPQ